MRPPAQALVGSSVALVAAPPAPAQDFTTAAVRRQQKQRSELALPEFDSPYDLAPQNPRGAETEMTKRILARPLPRRRDALLTTYTESRPELSSSILQAFLRARAGTGVRPTGRRCSSGRHFRSICLFSVPWGRRSGSGESWFDPRRGDFKGRWAYRPRPFRLPLRDLGACYAARAIPGGATSQRGAAPL